MGENGWRRLLGSAATLVPVVLAFWASTLRHSPVVDGAGRALLTLGSQSLFKTLEVAAFAMFAILAVPALIPSLRWRPFLAVVCWASFVSYGLVCMSGWGAPWVSREIAIPGRDGATYRVGGDADECWIVREVETRWDRIVVELVAGEWWEHGVARVIRPAGAPAKEQDTSSLDLRIDRSGRVYVLGAALVLVAYDPRGTARPPKGGYDEDREYVRRGMTGAEISPFALLSEHDTGNETDVHDFVFDIAAARDDPDRRSRALDEAVLLAALDDPNPWIAKTARTFVEKGGTTLYPSAMQRLPR